MAAAELQVHTANAKMCSILTGGSAGRMLVHEQALHVSLLSALSISFCRSLLEELLAIARATRGKEPTVIDLSQVGEEFDPMVSV
jgi:hypothetical protein